MTKQEGPTQRGVLSSAAAAAPLIRSLRDVNAAGEALGGSGLEQLRLDGGAEGCVVVRARSWMEALAAKMEARSRAS